MAQTLLSSRLLWRAHGVCLAHLTVGTVFPISKVFLFIHLYFAFLHCINNAYSLKENKTIQGRTTLYKRAHKTKQSNIVQIPMDTLPWNTQTYFNNHTEKGRKKKNGKEGKKQITKADINIILVMTAWDENGLITVVKGKLRSQGKHTTPLGAVTIDLTCHMKVDRTRANREEKSTTNTSWTNHITSWESRCRGVKTLLEIDRNYKMINVTKEIEQC